ncbi:MAG: cyclic nucleotide-binding domain-containing protein [Actinomycetota bacterium]
MFGRNNKIEPEWLSGVDFFAGFPHDELREISNLGDREDVTAGTQIIDQGRVGDRCFVIVSGTANVFMRGEYVATVGSGSMVGEMALVDHGPRTASVVAESDMTVVAYDIGDFDKLLRRSPSAYEAIMVTLQDRVAANRQRD